MAELRIQWNGPHSVQFSCNDIYIQPAWIEGAVIAVFTTNIASNVNIEVTGDTESVTIVANQY